MVNFEQSKGEIDRVTESLSQLSKIDSPDFEFLLSLIARDAWERRNTNSEYGPHKAMKLIRESRLGSILLPIEFGGIGVSIRDLFYVVVKLAEADPDVAHILRSHYRRVEQLVREGVEEGENRKLIQYVADGLIFGSAFTEISSHHVGKLVFDTTITEDDDVYRLNGTKYFTTGTLYADLVTVAASTLDGEVISATIPTNRNGVIIEDDWDGIGQKYTASGTTRFLNVLVHKEEIDTTKKNKTPFNSFAQLYLQAVIAGILRSVLTDASNLVKNRKRTFSFAAAELPKEDPQLLQVIGEISSIAYTAETLVLTAAEAIDNASKSAINGVIDYDLSHHASLLTAQAKVIIDALALKASTLLFDVGGASATKQSVHLDRHWRNIRTLASHNPAAYKARAIGDYIVNGKKLPLDEVYF
ncbi:acyl-CoA dehydrogenase family protein [Ureibacillus sinduriensis]|uniref:Acyl-CoA dehydrogenase n=1 Tax=Ureibacillus sinduriensis BLB-1 = JCM 15800 TaxID=1384057 RepID=A0A0A3HXK4_9BACL|nr:acyl-CoA dehydrogenase family protein [Ureibacillus sinduriensis]KGR75103.1 acyl-CoA dehydrogenase [Ureibacillus sinduriensis BLB-1 = JCM 15800]